jgi:TBC1 domain family protein 5
LYETRSRFEVDQQLAQLKRGNQKLGESITWILGVLQEGEASDGKPDSNNFSVRHNRALDSLTYVRDVLLDTRPIELDESRLFDSKELQRKKAQADAPFGLSPSLSAPASTTHEPMTRPLPTLPAYPPTTILPNYRPPPNIPQKAVHSSPASPSPSHLPSPSLSRLPTSSTSSAINLHTKQPSAPSLREPPSSSSRKPPAARQIHLVEPERRKSPVAGSSLHDPLGALG